MEQKTLHGGQADDEQKKKYESEKESKEMLREER